MQAARVHYERATTAFDLQRYGEAAREYELAYRLVLPRTALLFNIGQSYRLARDSARAIRAYMTFLSRVPNASNRGEVQKRINEMRHQLMQFGTSSFSEIRDVQVFDQPMGKLLGDWTLNSNPFLLGLGVVGMTQSPLDPAHVFAMKPIDYQAADVPVPFDNQPVSKSVYYMQAPPSGGFTSIASVRAAGNVVRTAWVDSSTNSSPDSAYYVNDSGSGPILAGPLTCNASVCGTPFRLTAVVPDPTDSTHVIGICQAASTSTVAHVVRFAATGTCDVLFDGSTLPSLVFPVRVALRMN